MTHQITKKALELLKDCTITFDGETLDKFTNHQEVVNAMMRSIEGKVKSHKKAIITRWIQALNESSEAFSFMWVQYHAAKRDSLLSEKNMLEMANTLIQQKQKILELEREIKVLTKLNKDD
tara:strand:+ start:155 stop:517 length:363 start_codon:yes stop_codon:yes gene_type:complete